MKTRRNTLILGILATFLSHQVLGGFSVTRDMPEFYQSNVPLTITLKTHMEADHCGGAVVENLPHGWRVSNIRGPGAGYWNQNLDTIIWAPVDGPLCGGPPDSVFGYDLIPPATATGTYTIGGVLSVDGTSVTCGGKTALYPRPLMTSFDRSDTNSFLAFTSASNVLYSVQRSSTLTPPQWVTLGINLTGSGEIMRVIDNSPANSPSMFYRILVQATAATRLCPARYATNAATPVKVTVTLTPEVCQAIVIEAPPVGWQITDVGSGGALVGTNIVWALPGPSCGGTNFFTLTYNATAPGNESAIGRFSGQIAISGITNLILGNTEVLPPFADVPNIATRTLPTHYTPGTPFEVAVDATMSPSSCSGVIVETPPAGCAIAGAWVSPSGSIIWTTAGPDCGGASTHRFTYTVTPPLNATGILRFSGVFSVDGTSKATEGTSSMPKWQ